MRMSYPCQVSNRQYSNYIRSEPIGIKEEADPRVTRRPRRGEREREICTLKVDGADVEPRDCCLQMKPWVLPSAEQ